jgi:molecular chaperone GrpE
MTKKDPKKKTINKEIVELQQQLGESLEREKRILADYQNLVKRNQEERVKFLQLANQGLIETILSPLEHLSLAAEQIEDQGLDMVIRDFWQVLEEAGVEEIYPKGEKFNLETMEVVDKEGEGQTVAKVVKRGYRLNGLVIQHAKVIVK